MRRCCWSQAVTRGRTVRLSLMGLVCLFLGAATTVGVAWWMRYHVPWPLWLGLGEGCLIPYGVTMTQSDSDQTRWPLDAPPAWGEPEVLLHASYAGFLKRTAERFDPARGRYYMDVEMSGWPLRSMISDRRAAPGLATPHWPRPGQWIFVSWRTGVWYQPSRDGASVGFAYPCIPILPGFAADTVLYAAAWWLLLFTPLLVFRTARRRCRVSRGMCGACGYDLKGSPGGACPECGLRGGSQVQTIAGAVGDEPLAFERP
jgi:hypothetical protein